jgi:hypothetical protein
MVVLYLIESSSIVLVYLENEMTASCRDANHKLLARQASP